MKISYNSNYNKSYKVKNIMSNGVSDCHDIDYYN